MTAFPQGGCASNVEADCESGSCTSVCRQHGYPSGVCVSNECHCNYDVGGNSNWNPWAVPDGGDACGSCPAYSLCCEGTCININSDPENCGLCGRVCPEGEACVNGWCSCGGHGGCITDYEKCCTGVCVNVMNDPTNCGECDTECLPETGPECVEGACVCPNLTGTPRACDGTHDDMCCARTFLAAGGCFDLDNDREHCGTCDVSCPFFEGSTCLFGECTEMPE